MRLLLGIIIGILLTIGGAYVADSAGAAGARPMVNWDVVGHVWDGVTASAREGWHKITG